LAVAGTGRRAFDRPGYPRRSWRLVARASGRARSAAAYRYLGADLSARAIAGGSGAGAGTGRPADGAGRRWPESPGAPAGAHDPGAAVRRGTDTGIDSTGSGGIARTAPPA